TAGSLAILMQPSNTKVNNAISTKTSIGALFVAGLLPGIVQALMDAQQVTVIHTGGQLDHDNHSSVGGLAVATLRQVVTDIAFVSTSSWDLHRGIT
ncbi:hypothetical protein Q6272_28745, partial [Klebsiella pneumoniae]|nr:hypothetical protein [Klebsiella pneumoniae]